MKILHLTDEPWDSGISTYAIQVAKVLQDNGHQVFVGVRSGKKPEALAKANNLTTVAINNFFELKKFLSSSEVQIVNAHTGRMHTWSLFCQLLTGSRNGHRVLVRTRGDARPL